MADILSTLRELRSLEEKRAHGTLSPVEEQRFQELQTLVSSRGPKPGPPTPIPLPSPVAPSPPPAAAVVDAEPPFVDADLTEDATLVAAAPMPPGQPVPQPQEPQAPPMTAVETGGAVPMSPAELRQWTASFSPVVEGETARVQADVPAATPPVADEPAVADAAETASAFSAPVELPAPSASEWLAPTPAAPTVVSEVPPALPVDLPEAPMNAAPEPTPEPTQITDDAPMVWSEPEAAPALPPVQLLDDSWSASMSAIPVGEADNEPTRLTSAAAMMDPTLADSFEPPPQAPARSSDSSSGVTSKRMTPIGEAFAAGESRVVVHMLGGVQKRGSLVDAHMNADFLELRLPDGGREMLSTAALKAVFFVVPIGQDVPKPVGDPVTVTLQDGHQLTGLSPDYQVGAVGFFLCPTDQRSRTAKIYIYAGAVKGIS